MNSIQPQPESQKYEPKFIFVDGENEIVFINSYSAIESVYINGHEVYSHRKIAKKSVIEIEYNSNIYRFEIDVKIFFLGTVVCSFSKNGDIVSIKKLVYKNMASYYSFITLLVAYLTFSIIYYSQSILVLFVVSITIFGVGKMICPIKPDYVEIKKN